MSDLKPVIIGVAGGSGSGKTTVVKNLLEQIGSQHVILIQHDSYYHDQSHLPRDERASVNYDHPDTLETSLLAHHLEALLAGRPAELPVYDFARHARKQETMRVEPKRVIIVDGILILNEPALRDLMDLRLYVDTDPDVRFIRRLRRDIEERGRSMESVVAQYLSTVRPMHREFVEPSKRFADLIIPEGGSNRIAIEVLMAKIQSLLSGLSTLSPRSNPI